MSILLHLVVKFFHKLVHLMKDLLLYLSVLKTNTYKQSV